MSTKLGLNRQQFHKDRKSIVCILILFGILFALSMVSILREAGNYFALYILLCSATMVLLALADLLPEAGANLAVVLMSVGTLALLAGIACSVVGMSSGSVPLAVTISLCWLLVLGFGIPYLQWCQDKRQHRLSK